MPYSFPTAPTATTTLKGYYPKKNQGETEVQKTKMLLKEKLAQDESSGAFISNQTQDTNRLSLPKIQKSTETVSGGGSTSLATKLVPPGMISSLDASVQAQKDAMAQQAALEKDNIEMQGQESQKMFEKAETDYSDYQTSQDVRKAQREDMIKRFTEIHDMVVDQKVDNRRAWNRMETGDKVIASIAVFLGGLGAGMQGSNVNQAQQNINKIIDDDIKDQKFNIQQAREDKRDAIAYQSNLMGFIDSQAKDEKEAYLMKKAAGLEMVKLKLDAMTAGSKSAIILAQKDQLVAKLEQDNKYNQIQLLGGTKTETNPTKPTVRKTETEINTQKFEVPGVGFALTEDDAKLAKATHATEITVNKNFNKLIDLRETYGSETINRDVVAVGKLLAADLRIAYKDLAKLGVLSKDDYSILDAIIPPDPTQIDWTSNATYTQITKAKQLLQDKVDATYESLGLKHSTQKINTLRPR